MLEGVGQSCAALLASAEVSLVEVGGAILVVVDEALLVLGKLID
jgi:hypothetical protein